jgi:hypothetical protein
MRTCRFKIILPRGRASALHRADRALRHRLLVDLRLAVLHHQLGADADGLIDQYIDFLGSPWNARIAVIIANVWRGVPFVAITLLAGLQTISPSLLRSSIAIDGATSWQRFRHVTMPLLTPIIAVVMTFSVLFTFTDFQLIYVITRGGPLNATHLMATLSFQRGISGGATWRRRGHCDRHGALPAGLRDVQLLRPAAAEVAAGWSGQMKPWQFRQQCRLSTTTRSA